MNREAAVTISGLLVEILRVLAGLVQFGVAGNRRGYEKHWLDQQAVL